MKKRVAVARAIVRNPAIILYDEPTSGLDPIMAHSIENLIVRLKEGLRVTSVIVTHDIESAYRVADRIAMLFKGQIVEVGTPSEIRKSNNPVVTQFIHGEIK
jgi:phospholipid/cholesterol/gamma-HCH transport system ATP-binding protein